MSNPLYNTYAQIYSYAKDRGVPARFVYKQKNLVDGLEEIKDMIRNKTPLIKIYDLMSKIINIEKYDIVYIFMRHYPEIGIGLSEAIEEVNRYFEVLNKRVNQYKYKKLTLENIESNEGYKAWLEDFTEEVHKDSELISSHNQFLRNLELKSTINKEIVELSEQNLKIKEGIYNYFLKYIEKNKRPEPEDGFTIYNKSNPSFEIPVIIWNDEHGNKKIKVYENAYLHSFEPINIGLNSNTISFYYYYRQPKTKKDIYYLGTINLETGVLEIKIDNDYNQDVFNSFEDVFSTLNIDGYEIKNIKGSYLIPVLKGGINNTYFRYTVMTNPYFKYFYFHDVKYRPTNTQLILNFKGFKGSKNYYKNNYVPTATSIRVSLDEYVEIKGITYQKVRIRKATSLEEIYTFQNFLSILINYYDDRAHYQKVNETFKDIIYSKISPKFTESITTETVIPLVRKHAATSKIMLLKQYNSEFFSYGGARSVGCANQPIIIEDDEIDEWKQLLTDEGEERQVISFPPPEANLGPSFNYVCPGNQAPYIEFKEKKILGDTNLTPEEIKEHREKYPYIITCVKKKSYLEDLINYTQKKDKRENLGAKRIGITNRLITFGQQSMVFNSINSLFKYLDSDIEEVYFNGTDISNNSLLQAVMIGTDHVFSRNKKERLKELTNIRNRISEEIYPGTFSQELYGESPEQIIRRLKSNEYLDSALFYRGLEEYFGVNIVVLRPKKLKNIKTSIDPSIIIEVPRAKEFHVSSFDVERPTIILYKTMGSESDSDVINPQYQFLYNNQYIEFNEKLEEVLTISNQTYIWSYDQEDPSYESLKCRLNPTSLLNWTRILEPYKIKSQLIDGYGKVRAFIIDAGGKNLTVIVPPSYPLNLPLTETVVPSEEKIVRSIFGDPIDISDEGFWYSVLDYEYGIFIPVANIPLSKINLNSPPPPISLKRYKDTDYFSYISFKKSVNLLLEMIEWCWRWRDDPDMGLEDWWETYINTEKDTSESQPNFKNIQIFFPQFSVADTDSAIYSLHNWWPDIFGSSNINKRQYIYLSREASKRIKLHFEKLDRDTYGLNNNPSYYVKNFYELNFDVAATKNSFTFNNQESFEKWLKLHNKTYSSNIRKKIDIDLLGTEPILFMDSGSKIYLIQKLKFPTLQNAVALSVKWIENGRNMGYNYNSNIFSNVDKLPPFGIMQVNKEGELIGIEDHTHNQSEYHLVIQYGNNSYTALLPLL